MYWPIISNSFDVTHLRLRRTKVLAPFLELDTWSLAAPRQSHVDPPLSAWHHG